MKASYRMIVGATALTALIALTGAASAQVVAAPAGPVNETTTASTNTVTPGATGMNFGTIQLSGNGSYSVMSIPIMVTPSSGASTSNLSNCSLMNSNGSALTTGNNVVNTIGSGSNIFTFDTPLLITSATTSLTIECNVSSSTASGATFDFIAGTPTLTPSIGVMLDTVPSVHSGTNNAILGIITLDGSGSGANTTVSSLPITISENGASQSDLTDCSLHSATNLSTALNTGTNAVNSLLSNGGVTTFMLDTPFAVPMGSGELLELTCNVSSQTPAGSTITIAVNPSGIVAENASTDSSITPSASISSGTAEPVSGTIEITAPSTTTTTSPVTTTVPGAPNTGAGGNALLNLMLLALSGGILALGGSFLALRRN